MVRLSPQNRECPIQLLEHHNPGELMGKRKRPQTPAGCGPCEQRRIQAVGAADHQRQRPGCQQPAFQLPGQLPAAPAGTRPGPAQRPWSARGSLPRAARPPPPLGRGVGSPAGLADLLLPEGDVALQPAGVVVSGLRGSTAAACPPHDAMSTPYLPAARCPAARLQAYIPRSRCTAATRSIACM